MSIIMELQVVNAYRFLYSWVVEDLINSPHLGQDSAKRKGISNSEEPMLDLKICYSKHVYIYNHVKKLFTYNAACFNSDVTSDRQHVKDD